MGQPNGKQGSAFEVNVSRIEGTDKTVLTMSITLGPDGLAPMIALLTQCLSDARSAVILPDRQLRNQGGPL